MRCTKERSLTHIQAWAAWQNTLATFNLAPIHKISQFNNHKVPLCFLNIGPYTVRGAGKGKSILHNQLSANYEAIEFFLSGINYHKYPILLKSQLDIAKQARILPYRCSDIKFLSEENQSKMIPWVIYADIKNQEKFAVPLLAVDLSYGLKKIKKDEMDYGHCDFYCASNGLGSGTTVDAAIIHATLELIERDAHSYFFIDTFLLNKKIRAINHESLPKSLLKAVLKIEREFKSPLIIFKLPSRFDVPVYGAAFLHCPFEAAPRGAGASLDPKIALERAIYEAAQSYNLVHNDYYKNESSSDIFKYNLVKNSTAFPIRDLIYNKKVVFEDFESKKDYAINNNYLAILIDKVHRYSRLLINILYNRNNVACVRAIIPDAEEFFLICHGLKQNPNLTTLAYIKMLSGVDFDWNNLEIGGNYGL